MKTPVSIGMAMLVASAAQAGFAPIPITPESYNADVVVENTVKGVVPVTTATMDGGTNNGANTWYEQGYNTAAPDTGLPPAGTVFSSQTFPNHKYSFAPFTTNCVVLLDAQVTNATWTLKTPKAYGVMSILTAGGNGGCQFVWTVHYEDGSSESGTNNSPDWYNSADPALISKGRIDVGNFTFNTVNDANNPRLLSRDFTLSKPGVVVKSVDLKYDSSRDGAHSFFMAISGAPTAADDFEPIDVTGYNYDGVVEAVATRPGSIQTATTASLDGGFNNTGATWYEQGFYPPFPKTGLPAAGSLLTNVSATDHVYKLAPSYIGMSNAIVLDDAHAINVINVKLQTPAKFAALSLLGSAGGGSANISYTINYTDGNTDVGFCNIPDWYNNTPAYVVNGRVNVESGASDTINANNPRLCAIDFTVGHPSSLIQSIDFGWNSVGSSAHVAIMALSGNAGAVKPIIDPQPQSVKVNPGDVVTLTAGASGTAPFTYQWQKTFSFATNAVFTNLTDTAIVLGSKDATLTLNGATMNENARYQIVVKNSAGSATSSVAVVTVISPLKSVAAPGDSVSGFGGSWPGAETPPKAIDGTTTKYLNFGKLNTGFIVTPSVGQTIVTGLRLYTANDALERDPSSYIIEGSDDGVHYSVISSNALALPDARNGSGATLDPMNQNMQQVMFANATSYASYKVTFPTVKNNSANSMQIGEVEILGVTDTSGRPHFTKQPVDVNVYVGDKVTLTATGAGTPAPTYQWKKGTAGVYTDIPGATTDTLTIDKAKLSDSMDYVVVASNAAGTMTSTAAKVNVLSSTPSILAPGDTVVSFGNKVSDRNSDPLLAVDGTLGKYVNIGSGYSATAGFGPFQGPCGVVITPLSGSAVVTGMRIFTSDSDVITDPADYMLEGSNDGETFTLISSGALALPDGRNNNDTKITIDPLTQANQEVDFANGTAYTVYRITFTNVKDNKNAAFVSVAELQLLGGPASSFATLSIVDNKDGTVTISSTVPGELFSTSDVNSTSWTSEGALTDTVKVTVGSTPKFFRLVVQ